MLFAFCCGAIVANIYYAQPIIELIAPGMEPVVTPVSIGQYRWLSESAALRVSSDVDALLERAGVQRKIRLRVPHFIAVGPILQSTDLIATVPQRLAERIEAPFGLATSAHPARLPDIAINLFWHAKYHRDPANLWLRQLLVELFADAPSPV